MSNLNLNSKSQAITKAASVDQRALANLKKYLIPAVLAFERVREWADYSQWLSKIAKVLEDYPCPVIPEKLTLAKRLAQCLNPNLPPAIHLSTLQVYNIIFRNMKANNSSWSADLGIYSIGIFPFFQYASFQVKPVLLDIYREHYFPLKKELIPCVPGLVLSILPGLDEANEEFLKKVYDTLDALGKAVGRKYFVGAIWMAMLRTPKVRQASIKYLSKRLGKTYEVNEENEEENATSESEDEIVNKPPASKIEEKKVSDVRGKTSSIDHKIIMIDANDDFSPKRTEYNFMDITKSRIGDDDIDVYENEKPEDRRKIDYPNKSSLILNALIASLEDELNLTQRLTLDFLHSHFKLGGDLFTDQEKCILIEATLNLLLRKDLAITRRVYTWLFGPPDLENKYQITEKNQYVLGYIIAAFRNIFLRVPQNAVQASLPLKVLQNFYMEHDHLVEKTLKDLSIPFLTYIQNNTVAGSEYTDEINKAGIRFMENITSHFATILNSLSEALDNEIIKKNNEKCLQIINLIEFTFKLESSISNKDENIDLKDKRNYLKSIISGILRSASSITVSQIQNIPFIKIALSLNMNLIDNLLIVEEKISSINNINGNANNSLNNDQQYYYEQMNNIDNKFEASLNIFADFYDQLVDTIIQYGSNIESESKLLSLYSISSDILIKTQKFQLNKTYTQLPKWFNSIIQSIKSSYPSFSIIGIKTILEILEPENNDELVKNLRSLIPYDKCRLTMEKLWNLLDVHYYQNKVSEFIMKFQFFYPDIFADTISDSFQVPSITEKENAIRRFASFWKLSSDSYQNTNIISNNHTLNNILFSGIGLFIMLDFLDNDNPLLRHTSKSWLLDSIPYLYRIIDPIFEVLMQVSTEPGSGYLNLYVSDTRQYFFTHIYDTRRVSEAFRKLKSILITANELFMRYISTIKISDTMKSHKQFFYEIKDELISRLDQMTYSDLLVTLCLKYIQGHAIESLSPKFQMENSSVNASSCEFLELLITHLETKELSARVTHSIIEHLLIVLSHAINNNDYILQVQLLNLLKIILFQSGFCTVEEYKTRTINILSSQIFIPNLLKGLNTEMPYVRVQFINFISMSISILTENLKQPTLTNCIRSILTAYFTIIMSKKLEISENNDEFEPFDSDNWTFDSEDITANTKKIKMQSDSSTNTSVSSSISGSDHITDMQKKSLSMMNTGSNTRESQGKNDRQNVNTFNKSKQITGNTFSLRYQNQNEIYILLDGVKKILQFFLKFKLINEEQANDKNLGPSAFDFMKDILSFNIFFRGQEIKKEVFNPQFPETCKAILDNLYQVVEIYIYCWRLSREFREWSAFTPLGIMPYSFERYNEINKNIKEMHMKIDTSAKNVRSQIIAVTKPLFYQYTGETINAFVNFWINQCEKYEGLKPIVNPKMMKEIEIIVSMNIPVDTFLNALSKNKVVLELSSLYNAKQPSYIKKNTFLLNYKSSNMESRILFFVYTYVSFAYIDISVLKKDNLIKLWTTVTDFIRLFISSKAPSTILWLLELLYLLSLKYNPKEILAETKIKKEMHNLMNILLLTASSICSKSLQIYFNDPSIKPNMIVNNYKIILPLSPTIYEIYKKYNDHKSKNENNNDAYNKKQNFQQDSDDFLDNISIDRIMFEDWDKKKYNDNDLYEKYRLFCFKTHKRISLHLIQNTYSPERIDRIVKRTREFMEQIFPIMENKTPENQLFLECASELLHSLLEAARSYLIKDFKPSILHIFNGTDFFKCTKQTLKYWSKIIDWVLTSDKSDLFSEFLNKVSSFSILFSKDAETKQKIKAFERICFIIYSGDRDRYQDKLMILLEKMAEVIRNADTAHPSLLILILFCVRILILRLTSIVLNDLFRNIWPILLTLLIQIFNKKNTQKNPNLILAALKLIELMSIVQLDEFYTNQWVFLFDYFGLTLESTKMAREIPDENNPDQTRIQISDFEFQPYITNCIHENCKINYNNLQLQNQITYAKMNREIVMTMTNVESESKIKTKALFLCQYLIQQNEFRSQVDPDQIESLIEGDFISLDDYIFKIN